MTASSRTLPVDRAWPGVMWSPLLEVTPPTGEPDAGNPHVRFGGRGSRNQSALPTPIIPLHHILAKKMDARVKPAHDDRVNQIFPIRRRYLKFCFTPPPRARQTDCPATR